METNWQTFYNIWFVIYCVYRCILIFCTYKEDPFITSFLDTFGFTNNIMAEFDESEEGEILSSNQYESGMSNIAISDLFLFGLFNILSDKDTFDFKEKGTLPEQNTLQRISSNDLSITSLDLRVS